MIWFAAFCHGQVLHLIYLRVEGEDCLREYLRERFPGHELAFFGYLNFHFQEDEQRFDALSDLRRTHRLIDRLTKQGRLQTPSLCLERSFILKKIRSEHKL